MQPASLSPQLAGVVGSRSSSSSSLGASNGSVQQYRVVLGLSSFVLQPCVAVT
jgi:hypothetical protein